MFNITITEEFYEHDGGGCWYQKYSNRGVSQRTYGAFRSEWEVDGMPIMAHWSPTDKCSGIRAVGYRYWYIDETYRLRGEYWFLDKMYHNEGGPARKEWDKDGTLIEAEYFLYNIKISNQHYNWATVMGISDIMNMQDEEQALFKITWGNQS